MGAFGKDAFIPWARAQVSILSGSGCASVPEKSVSRLCTSIAPTFLVPSPLTRFTSTWFDPGRDHGDSGAGHSHTGTHLLQVLAPGMPQFDFAVPLLKPSVPWEDTSRLH